MNPILITRLEKLTSSRNLAAKSWQDIVDTVILQQLTGPCDSINDRFINFLADNMGLLYQQDRASASVLAEIALQRLSRGAVPHHGTIYWLDALPQKYWHYSSKWAEPHVMTEGCFNFLLRGIGFCMSDPATRQHAKNILFGVMGGISANGRVFYYQYEELGRSKRITLHFTAQQIIEACCSYEEIYAEYAFPELWEEHRRWFAKHYEQINWPQFFSDTQCDGKNIFLRPFRRRRIKEELLKEFLQLK